MSIQTRLATWTQTRSAMSIRTHSAMSIQTRLATWTRTHSMT
ncbi:TPA: hypothetical protein ACSY7W_06295 [Listeria monocytogenes]